MGWYSTAAATHSNCRGPRGNGMTYRLQRGGSWNVYADKVRSAYRGFNGPADAAFSLGFQCA